METIITGNKSYERKTLANAVALKACFLKWHDVDPERLYIKDVMTLRGEDKEGEYEEFQFQATVKGLTDWYAFKIDEQGNPIPASITPLPF